MLNGAWKPAPTPGYALRRSQLHLVTTLPADAGRVVADGDLYLVRSRVIQRLDPASGQVLASARTPKVTAPPFRAGHGLWLAAGSQVVELDTTSLRVEHRFSAPGTVTSLAVAGSSLWYVVPANGRDGAAGRLYRQPLQGGHTTAVAFPARTDPGSHGSPVSAVMANAAGTQLAVTFAANITMFARLDPATGAVLARYQLQADNVIIDGIAGDIAWVVGGVGHNNVLAGVDLRTGRPRPITGTAPASLAPPGTNGQGGWLQLTGQTLIETFLGAPDACINPATGRARSYLTLPAGLDLAGIADHRLIADTTTITGRTTRLLETSVPGCT
ncbi:hypothetical protein GHK86_17390 [Acidimicrobiaceae bacterium USS-CC1]|uniref:Uncharacterized protein n=1 Tax=Acidiferrimicrobium australe TaxID=2664430 RepID=A0ABW9QX93_9ACTN|nr:hypothetical protein [Acidiferrimicrobium australe]